MNKSIKQLWYTTTINDILSVYNKSDNKLSGISPDYWRFRQHVCARTEAEQHVLEMLIVFREKFLEQSNCFTGK